MVRRVIATICERRSIREGFLDEPIATEVIEDIVRCGLAAPSSKNAQPWRLHVVTDRAIIVELADQVQNARDADSYVPIDPRTGGKRTDWPSTVSESAEVLRSVSLAIFVENLGSFSAGRASVSHAADTVRESAILGYSLELVGIGAAVQSMWLAAHTHGLGGVFMGDVLIAEKSIQARLGLRGDLLGVLALAYSTGSPTPKRMSPDRVVYHR
jgi:nitroreductase